MTNFIYYASLVIGGVGLAAAFFTLTLFLFLL